MDYEQLEHVLTRRSHDSRGGGPGDPRGEAVAALEAVASGARTLRAVRHPLGFLCLPLLRDGQHGVCVHLFGAHEEPTRAAEPMHAHSWQLLSYVLYGHVGNIPVRVREAAREATHRVFEVRSAADGIDEVLPTARLVRGDPGPAHVSSRGETYALAAGEFHATAAGREAPAATLVLGRTSPGRTDLSLGPLHGRGHRMVRQLCDAGQTAHSARLALRRIHGERRR